MRRLLHGVALLALVAVVSACSGHSRATRLKIEVAKGSGAVAYALRCGPAGGTAPQPAAICTELDRSPNLLVGGPAFEHSCPPGNYEAFRVSGTYRGYPIEATFATGNCGWVPGQEGAPATWSYLMHNAGPGAAERELGSPHVTSAQRAHRRVLLRHQVRRIRQMGKLSRERQSRIAAGAIPAGRLPDSTAREALRDYVKAQGPPFSPFVADARVYSTTLGRADRLLGAGTWVRGGGTPIYLLVMHYGYRDYRGQKHRDSSPGWYLELDARTLRSLGGGTTESSNLHRFGPSLALWPKGT